MSLDGLQQLTGYRLRDYDDAITRLSESRDTQGISQRKLAEATDISQPSICNALRGTHELRARRLLALADALGYDLALIPRKDTP